MARTNHFGLECSERDGMTVLALRGELDIGSSPQLATALDAVCAEDRRVVVDLRGLQFMDSTGLAVLLRYHGRSRDGRFDLVVVRGPEAVDRVFRMTEADSLMEVIEVP